MASDAQDDESPQLKRSLGLIDVIGLGVNAVIGQGIFLSLPLAVALMGPASLTALLMAAFLAFLIALCFAEVGSRFRSTGGAYTYAREAFGPFVGFEVGWMLIVVCVVSWAALATGFTLVLEFFVPQVTQGINQKIVALGIMTFMAFINLQGAKTGGMISTICSVAKLVPLLVFVAVGLWNFKSSAFTPFAPHGYGGLTESILILLYPFVGFESSVVPAGEMEDPKKAVPLSLVSVMTLVCLIYLGVFLACMSLLSSDMASAKNPVADAAAIIFGNGGASLIAAGIVISSLGINAAQALVGPRKLFAMAESGDLPPFLAKVDEKTGVPKNAILVAWVAAALLTLSGTFKELAVLGVLARFAQYIATAAALFVFRGRDKSAGEAEGFRVPGGPVVAGLSLVLIVWLMFNTAPEKLLKGLVALLLGIPFYFWSRRKGPAET